MKRREFFKSIGGIGSGFLLAPGLAALPSLPAFKETCAGKSRDEAFWKFLREQFLLPKDYTYLNTGGLGSSPLPVRNRVKQEMDAEDAHPGPSHDEKNWWKIKEKCAALLGTGVKKEELALTGTATEGINIILNGLPLKKGDEIITSTHEHVALNVPLLNKIKSACLVIKTFVPDLRNSCGCIERIEKLVTKKTRLIFTSHITCTTGQVFPVKEIGQLAKSKGLWYALDGVQAVGQIPVNLKETGVDFYAVSGHKWLLAPRRTGILYVRQSLLDTLKPTVLGTYSSENYDLRKHRIELHPTAQRYEYGTQNEALFYGLGDAVDFITTIGIGAVRDHNKQIAENFVKALKNIPGAELLSPAQEKHRSALISFRIRGRESSKICTLLGRKGIRVRHVQEAGLDGIRVSFHVYNSKKESDRLSEALREITRST
ncbi:MAG: aminotransferase class V-fold PLP-dependent enzyme [Candidatus Aminicenantes bacterium]|nr:aminotransferase class V-fold PLP-dependent enzyme [Candidatus Aminicenantes bacterium]